MVQLSDVVSLFSLKCKPFELTFDAFAVFTDYIQFSCSFLCSQFVVYNSSTSMLIYKYFLGGALALVTLAVDDDGHRTGNTRNCKVPFYQALYEVWKNMAKDGLITLVRE